MHEVNQLFEAVEKKQAETNKRRKNQQKLNKSSNFLVTLSA
jgi:hypothetical protein